ncbi:MAG: hypothetical protein ACK5CF_11040 [Opitutaceae bacterium]|jgi:hypothetical protein
MKTQRQTQHDAVSALTLIPEELLQPIVHSAPKAAPSTRLTLPEIAPQGSA